MSEITFTNPISSDDTLIYENESYYQNKYNTQ